MKKILILSLSCNQPYFQSLLGAVKNTWAKPLIQNQYPNVHWFGYTSCDNKHPKPCVDFEDHMIYVDCEDDLWHTYTKLKKAYNLIKDVVDFDFVLKTNTSLCVNLEKTIERINRIPDDYVMGRNITSCMFNEPFGVFQGFFAGMCKRLFEISLSSDGDELDGYDMVADDQISSWNLLKSGERIHIADINDEGAPYVYWYFNEGDKFGKPDYLYDNSYDMVTYNPVDINDKLMIRVRSIDRSTDVNEIERIYQLYNSLR